MSDNDNRENLPSASSMERFVSCAGSWQAEQGMPPLPEMPVTKSGTDIHDVMETGDDSGLSESESAVAERLGRLEHVAVRDWCNVIGVDNPPSRHAEERLWIRDRDNLSLVASAKLDVYYVHEGDSLIIDFKSGYKQATASDRNWQLMVQAIALWHEYPALRTFRVAIAASRLTSNLDMSWYRVGELAHAESELRHAIWKSKQPSPARTPGPWCQYCRANGHCAEAAAYSSIVLFNQDLKQWDKLSIVEAVAKMTPDQMAHVWVRSKIANIIFDNVEARLKNMAPDQLEKIGLKLKPGAEKTTVLDLPRVWETLSTLLTDEERLSCVSIGLPKMRKAVAKKLGIKEIAAREQVNTALAGMIEITNNKPSLDVIA